MRIDQVLPSYVKHDAIGAEVKIMQEIFKSLGYNSNIFVTENGMDQGALDFKKYQGDSNDLLIFHYSIGSQIPYMLSHLKSTLITRFHNITPPIFFEHEDHSLTRTQCLKGFMQASLIAEKTKVVWTPSHYNAHCLKKMGFNCEVKVFPVLRDYKYLANLMIDSRLYSNLRLKHKKNITFVGRIMPHKAQHDLMYYLPQNARLFLVGSWDKTYRSEVLEPLAQRLELKIFDYKPGKQIPKNVDIIIFSSIKDQELATIYHATDVFMSMSEHEGFCVPLVEAMHFGIPLLIHPSSAVTETAGEKAWVVDKNNEVKLRETLNRLLKDVEFHQKASINSLKRAIDFDRETNQEIFHELLKK